ncbi:MAG TPA: hypothetical protein PKZ36_00300 [Candidatus Paceibacterota bacterium]|nr:hypothetical protein [Candidatus Paceibacterota bacterium]HPT17843.1 hypothetical protein [Candidatus Paceibacterota bacterium]
MSDFKDKLSTFLTDLKKFKSVLQKEKNSQVRKRSLLEETQRLNNEWINNIKQDLNYFCQPEIIEKYDKLFEGLVQLSLSSGNLKKTYIKYTSDILKSFNNEIILKTHTKSNSKDINHEILDSLLSDFGESEEGKYLKEAIDCAKHDFMRAAIILGWCASIDCIHNKIEEIGFTQFNVVAAQMASAQSGRFKRFSGIQPVTSISELREIFDNQILWVLEGMGLIDINQHTRLRSCFDMRNQSAHPGDAPITSYNLMSFFSDLKEIIFNNDKIKIIKHD